MMYENYEKVTGIIRGIERGGNCCAQLISLETDSGPAHAVVTAATAVIDSVRLRRGMRVAVFYDTSLPTPAVFPPQYQAGLITVLRRDQDAVLKYFDSNLVAADQSLKLNLGPLTSVVTANGQRYSCSPVNAELLVYYSRTTYSIPAQTTPQRIVVLCGG